MSTQFEASGNMDDWPKNEPGKPTQAAVFGLYHSTTGRKFQMLWTGKFPELEQAMYWAAKKEVEAIRKGKWVMASRVLWQHDLTPEQAVETARKQMEPQLDRALSAAQNGDEEIDIGAGPLQEVDPEQAHGYYIEAAPEGDSDADPLSAWLLSLDPKQDKKPPEDPPRRM